MRYIVHEGKNEYIIDRSTIMQRTTLHVNGEIANTISKKGFRIVGENKEPVLYSIEGNLLGGMTLVTPRGNVKITNKLSVLEMILLFLPVSAVVAGLIMGGFCAFFGTLFGLLVIVFNAKVVERKISIVYKALICLAALAVIAGLMVVVYMTIGGTVDEIINRYS